jgi:quinol monooxygenase YgiN
MPVTYVIRFDVLPNRTDDFLMLLEGVLNAMRDEPSFHHAVLHRDPETAHRFMLYETWEDHDDVVNVQLHRPYRRAWHAALPGLLASPRDVSVWQPVRADWRRAASYDSRLTDRAGTSPPARRDGPADPDPAARPA